tara:strand:+ start:1229 stop:2122 length:894 start_codon:yes stop_codon:yes gene_type:complete
LTHIPVLLNEIIENLCIDPDGIYVDATYGAGGHTKAILKRINQGQIIAFDQDNNILNLSALKDERLKIINQNFIYLKNNLSVLGLQQVDGIIADLGLSSFQINSKRGFSYNHDSVFDMRMNPNAKLTASEIVNYYDFEQLRNMFRNLGEIKNHASLSREIIAKRENKNIKTVFEFLASINNCIPSNKKNKYLSKVFQAIRIEVNSELENLKSFLKQSCEFLKQGSRLLIISYHSLEDRLVKNFIKHGNFRGIEKKDIYGNNLSELKLIYKKPIVPSSNELKKNIRSRSAKLRVAVKL